MFEISQSDIENMQVHELADRIALVFNALACRRKSILEYAELVTLYNKLLVASAYLRR